MSLRMQPAAETRIVSLVPSLTELLVAIGLGRQLVGRTGFCIHPAEVVCDVLKVGGTKDVLMDRLRSCRPSHVLVNVDENRLETVQAIEGWPVAERPQLVVTHPSGPEDVPPLIEQLLAVFSASPDLPAEQHADMRRRALALLSGLRSELALTQPAGRPSRRVLYLVWRGPWMTVARDTYISRMLARVGWLTWPALDGGPHGAGRYPVLRGDEAWLATIDEVLLSSEPYAFNAAHRKDAQALCPRAQVSLVDGEALSWYGPRTLTGLRLLRQLAAAPALSGVRPTAA